MSRPTNLSIAEAKAASAIPMAATAFGVAKVADTVKAIGESIEGLAYLAIFVYVIAKLRRLLSHADLTRQGLFGVGISAYYSDEIGFGVGPLIAKFFPGNMQGNGQAVANKFHPGTAYVIGPNVGEFPQVREEIAQAGHFTGVFARDAVSGDMVLQGFHLNWADAIFIASITVLLIKGGAGLIAAVIP